MPDTDEEQRWWAEREELFGQDPETRKKKAEREARVAVADAIAKAAARVAADLRGTADAAEAGAWILTDLGVEAEAVAAAEGEAAAAVAAAETAEEKARDLQREAWYALDEPEPAARLDEASWRAYFLHFYGVDAPLNADYEARREWTLACAPPDVGGQQAEYLEANDPGQYVDFDELHAERMGITPEELEARRRAGEAESEVRYAERQEHGNEEDLLAARLELGAATAALHAAVAAREAAYARRMADAGQDGYTDAHAQAAEKRAAAEQERAGKAQRAADEWEETMAARRGGRPDPAEPAARRPHSRRAERLQRAAHAALSRFTVTAEESVQAAASGDTDPGRQQRLDTGAALSARLFLNSYSAALRGPDGDRSLQEIARFAAARVKDGHHAADGPLPGGSPAAVLAEALYRHVISAGDLSTATDRIMDPASYARSAGSQADTAETRSPAARPAALEETTAVPLAGGVCAVKPAVPARGSRVRGMKLGRGRR